MDKKQKVSFFIEKLKKIKDKKIPLVIVGAIALLVLDLLVFHKPNSLFNKKKEYKSVVVKKKTLKETVSASGKIEAKNSAKLHFNAPAKVIWVGVERGDHVNKWQALASLDKRQLEKNLKKELLDYMNERWDHEQIMLDDYKDRVLDETIRRIKEKSQFDLDRDVLDVEIADLAVKESVLISPISGTVTEVEGILAGENLITTTLASSYIKVVDFSSLKFTAQVDEVDYAKIKIGQKVEIALDSFPDEVFKGTVSYIGKEGIKTAGGGVTIPIDIQFNSDGGKLAVGLNGDVEFIIEQKENVLVLPREYVKTKNNESIVYILEDGNLEEKKVKTGLSTLTQTEILEGVQKGEEIVLVKNNKK